MHFILIGDRACHVMADNRDSPPMPVRGVTRNRQYRVKSEINAADILLRRTFSQFLRIGPEASIRTERISVTIIR